MPIGRYFLFIGGVLLALLLLVDWQFPASSIIAARSDIDHTAIRIHSLHKWPDAVVFDTTQPTIVPPPVAVALEPAASAPKPVHEAFAMAAELAATAKPDAAKPVKADARRVRSARGPTRHAATPQPFGFANGWFAPPRREALASRNDWFGSGR